jgi:hypothetical protein
MEYSLLVNNNSITQEDFIFFFVLSWWMGKNQVNNLCKSSRSSQVPDSRLFPVHIWTALMSKDCFGTFYFLDHVFKLRLWSQKHLSTLCPGLVTWILPSLFPSPVWDTHRGLQLSWAHPCLLLERLSLGSLISDSPNPNLPNWAKYEKCKWNPLPLRRDGQMKT